jgi:predicted TIM-barrel fold metal-dependent hydrolase
MRWIDTHTHISSASPAGVPFANLVPDVLTVLEASGADLRFVLSSDLMPEIRDMMAAPEGVLEGNRFLYQTAQQAPDRLYPACMVNPHFLDASLKAMDVCFGEWGFLMLGEMLPYIMHFRMDSPPAERLVRKAVEVNTPVHVHISTSNSAQGHFSSGIDELLDLLELVERVPEATYLLAHLIGTQRTDPTVVEVYLNLLDRRLGGWPRNFWAEIKDFNSPGVRVGLERIPHDRILAGTDWVTRPGPPFLPYGIIFPVQRPEDNPYPPTVESLIGFLTAAGADAETVEAIAHGNAERLFGEGVFG